MSFGAAAVVGGAVVGGVLSSRAQKSAAKTAANAQTDATAAGIASQERMQAEALRVQQAQFDRVQALLQPYVESGRSALAGQMALAGTAGPQAQQAAIQRIQAGPEFAALTQAGEEAILQNASATGGLRGGNTQAALAQFRPQVLSALIEQQYGRLGGLATAGQNSAAGVGTAGMNFGANAAQGLLSTGANIAQLQQQAGAAQAGGALARGQATANMFGDISGAIGLGAQLGLFNGLGGSNAPATSPRPVMRPF